jgi:hypothetical protein
MAPTAEVLQRSTTEEHDQVESKRNRSDEAAVKMPTVADIGPPFFDDPYKAREYQKRRLALASVFLQNSDLMREWLDISR